MTIEERNKIPDAERIKQFCLITVRGLCDDLSDTQVDNEKVFAAVKESVEFIDKLVKIAKMADEIHEESEE